MRTPLLESSVSGHRFGDAANASNSDPPLGAGHHNNARGEPGVPAWPYLLPKASL